jgi:hypothetical protein
MMLLKLMFLLLSWAIWWGGLVAIIKVDQARRDRQMRAAGAVNFENKSVTQYLLFGLLCGGLVLPLYFWVTRKSAGAVLLGFAAGLGLLVVAGIVSAIGTAVTGLH